MAGDHRLGGRLHRGNRLTGGFFDHSQHPHFAGRNEQNGYARPSGSPGAANAMNVSLGVIRNIVIDDVADSLHVQPPRRDIGGDHNIHRVVLELLDGALA